MALSPEEEQSLLGIEQGLVTDDPVFVRRAAAIQRRMRLRQAIPFLLFTTALILVIALIVAILHDGGAGVPSPATPSGSIDEDLSPALLSY